MVHLADGSSVIRGFEYSGTGHDYFSTGSDNSRNIIGFDTTIDFDQNF
jgi:hypothetical protein